MSAIHYKFRSALEYKTLTFEGLQITVSELKRLIYENEKINRSTDFDLQITNAQTKMSYDEENTMVPRNASVVIARVPASNPQKLPKVWDKSTEGIVQRGRQMDAHRSFGSSNTLLERVDLTKKADMTEEEKLKEMERLSTREYDPSNFVRRRAVMTGPVPINYTCSRCNQTDHWINNCPLLNMRRTTGIPKDDLMETTPDDPQAMLTPAGTYAVSILHKTAKLIGKKEKPPFVPDDSPLDAAEKLAYSQQKPSAPEELLCKLCGDLLRDAVLIKCCCMSFCDECVRGCLLESDRHECPYCHKVDIVPDSLLPNAQLRQAVNSYRNETGYAHRSHTFASLRPGNSATPPGSFDQSQPQFSGSFLASRQSTLELGGSSTSYYSRQNMGTAPVSGMSAVRSHQEIVQYDRLTASTQSQPQLVTSYGTSTFSLLPKVDLSAVNVESQPQPKVSTPPYPFSTAALQSAGSAALLPPSFAASYGSVARELPPTVVAASVIDQQPFPPAVAAAAPAPPVILPQSSTPTVVQQTPHLMVQSGSGLPLAYPTLAQQHQPPPPGVTGGVGNIVSFTQQTSSSLLLPQHRPLTEEEFYLEKQRLLRKIKPKDEWEEFLERKDRRKKRQSRSPSTSSYESSISRRSSKSRGRSRSRRRDHRRSTPHRRDRRSRSRDFARRRHQRPLSPARGGEHRLYPRSLALSHETRRRRRSSSSTGRRRRTPQHSTSQRSGGGAVVTRFHADSRPSASALHASFLASLGHLHSMHPIGSATPVSWLPSSTFSAPSAQPSASSPPLSASLYPPGVDPTFAKVRQEYETSAVAPPLMATKLPSGRRSNIEKRPATKRSSSSDAESHRKKPRRNLASNSELGENLVELKDSVDSNPEDEMDEKGESAKIDKKKLKKDKKKHKKKHHKKRTSPKIKFDVQQTDSSPKIQSDAAQVQEEINCVDSTPDEKAPDHADVPGVELAQAEGEAPAKPKSHRRHHKKSKKGKKKKHKEKAELSRKNSPVESQKSGGSKKDERKKSSKSRKSDRWESNHQI